MIRRIGLPLVLGFCQVCFDATAQTSKPEPDWSLRFSSVFAGLLVNHRCKLLDSGKTRQFEQNHRQLYFAYKRRYGYATLERAQNRGFLASRNARYRDCKSDAHRMVEKGFRFSQEDALVVLGPPSRGRLVEPGKRRAFTKRSTHRFIQINIAMGVAERCQHKPDDPSDKIGRAYKRVLLSLHRATDPGTIAAIAHLRGLAAKSKSPKCGASTKRKLNQAIADLFALDKEIAERLN